MISGSVWDTPQTVAGGADGEPDGALLSITDITDEVDETRRAHELTRVLEASPDLVAIAIKPSAAGTSPVSG
mgnify:CR=1 FL=1